MRLFIGIHLSKSQRRAIARAQADLKRQGVTGRFTPEENLHLTLAFLGECDSNQRDTAVHVLKKMRFASFHLKLSQSGRFGDTIWAAPDSQPKLVELAGRLRQALERAGIAYDRKPFRPHITMLRRTKSAAPFDVHLDRADGVVTRIALIQSELGANGPRYTDIFTVDDRGRTWRRKPDTSAKRMTRDSKFLSLVLRHHPEKIGITLDRHGWADVDALIAGMARTRTFDRPYLEKIVRTDAKQRYAFNADHTKIRANQGHSIPVDVEPEQLTPPDILWHGTGEKSVAAILSEGIRPMGRLYVHLSKDPETAKKVGSRHGRPVVFQIDAGRMAKDGLVFYLSANGIWMTKVVPPAYLKIFSRPS